MYCGSNWQLSKFSFPHGSSFPVSPLLLCMVTAKAFIFSEDNLWRIPSVSYTPFLSSIFPFSLPPFFSSPFFPSLLPALCKLIYIIQSLWKRVTVRGAQHKNRKSFLFRFVNWQWQIKWILYISCLSLVQT